MTNIPSFSYKNTRRGIVVTIGVILLTLVLAIIFGVNPNKPTNVESGGQAFPATLPAIASGCGDIYRIPPVAGNFGVIPDRFYEANKPEDADVPTSSLTLIPIFGYMAKTGLPVEQIKFYSPEDAEKQQVDRTEMLRSMYDNNLLVIWYTSDLPDADVAYLKSYADVDRPGEVLVLPWTGDRAMVAGRNVAFASWGVTQTCSLFDEFVLDEFIDFTKKNYVDRPSVIPQAPLTADNKLFPIGPSIENK